MRLARVIGQVWGTRKAESLRGFQLLRVRVLSGDALENAATQGVAACAAEAIAVDGLGAGPGELVLVAHGSRCRDLTVGAHVADKDVVIAIVDAATIADPGCEQLRELR